MGNNPDLREGKSVYSPRHAARVYLADGQVIARRGLRDLLRADHRFSLVGETGDTQEMMRAVEALEPDILLVDLLLPGIDCTETITSLRARQPDLRILTLSTGCPPARILAALEAGALGDLPRKASEEEIFAALHCISKGQPSISGAVSWQLLGQRGHQIQKLAALTRREIEILCLIARGLSNQEIADQAHISEGTVRTHLTNIFGKLAVGNRVQATLYALRSGLTTLDECLGSYHPSLQRL
ncbi:MAG: response regulator transcription factor [Acidobacteriota bacterium]|nr:response regulator transcription factor [Acidobacteriota bacterium]